MELPVSIGGPPGGLRSPRDPGGQYFKNHLFSAAVSARMVSVTEHTPCVRTFGPWTDPVTGLRYLFKTVYVQEFTEIDNKIRPEQDSPEPSGDSHRRCNRCLVVSWLFFGWARVSPPPTFPCTPRARKRPKLGIRGGARVPNFSPVLFGMSPGLIWDVTLQDRPVHFGCRPVPRECRLSKFREIRECDTSPSVAILSQAVSVFCG